MGDCFRSYTGDYFYFRGQQIFMLKRGKTVNGRAPVIPAPKQQLIEGVVAHNRNSIAPTYGLEMKLLLGADCSCR